MRNSKSQDDRVLYQEEVIVRRNVFDPAISSEISVAMLVNVGDTPYYSKQPKFVTVRVTASIFLHMI